MEADRELILEDARSIRDAMWRMVRLAQDAAEALDARIEEEDLDGQTEATDVREALEQVHALSLKVRRGAGRLPEQARPQGGEGDSRTLVPGSLVRSPAVLTSVCVQADLSRCVVRRVLWVVEGCSVPGVV